MYVLVTGREVREQMFSEVKHLLHDLDAGMLPIARPGFERNAFSRRMPIAAILELGWNVRIMM